MKSKRLKDVGATVARMRRRFGMNQAKLGQRLWPDLSFTAAQTRVYRVEKGEYELTVEDTHRLFDILEINDIDAKTLLPVSSMGDRRGVLLDNRAFELFPDLLPYFELVNNNFRREDDKTALLHLRGMCKYLLNATNLAKEKIRTEEKKQVNGDLPFQKGAAGKEE
jgi:hypothetical protein